MALHADCITAMVARDPPSKVLSTIMETITPLGVLLGGYNTIIINFCAEQHPHLLGDYFDAAAEYQPMDSGRYFFRNMLYDFVTDISVMKTFIEVSERRIVDEDRFFNHCMRLFLAYHNRIDDASLAICMFIMMRGNIDREAIVRYVFHEAPSRLHAVDARLWIYIEGNLTVEETHQLTVSRCLYVSQRAIVRLLNLGKAGLAQLALPAITSTICDDTTGCRLSLTPLQHNYIQSHIISTPIGLENWLSAEQLCVKNGRGDTFITFLLSSYIAIDSHVPMLKKICGRLSYEQRMIPNAFGKTPLQIIESLDIPSAYADSLKAIVRNAGGDEP